jgi:cell division protein FtsL
MLEGVLLDRDIQTADTLNITLFVAYLMTLLALVMKYHRMGRVLALVISKVSVKTMLPRS